MSEAYRVFSVCIDSSVRIECEPYFFRYKGLECRYWTSADINYTDSLACKIDGKNGLRTFEQVFPVIAELISGISFYHDVPMDLEPGIESGPLSGDWTKVNITASHRKRIPIEEKLSEFLFIPDITSSELATILRLYRKARASSDMFLETLFYWHALTYPNQTEKMTVKYIDDVVGAAPQSLNYMAQDIQRIMKQPVLAKNPMATSLGEYIKNSVKNGLSHIVRHTPNDASIEIDSIDHMQHISTIADILREICRYRVNEDLKMTVNKTNNFQILNYDS